MLRLTGTCVLTGLFVLGPAVVSEGAGMDITSVTWTDDSGSVTSVNDSGPRAGANGNAVLDSFVAGGTTWDDWAGAVNVNFTSVIQYGYGAVGATDPGSAVAAMTDDRLDTLAQNLGVPVDFTFAAAPVNLTDLVFFFDYTAQGGNTWALIDDAGNLVGNQLDFTLGPAIGELEITAIATGLNFHGHATTIADFGVGASELGDVAGVRLISPDVRWDPMLVGLATDPDAPVGNAIPSPTALALGLPMLGVMALRRRRPIRA